MSTSKRAVKRARRLRGQVSRLSALALMLAGASSLQAGELVASVAAPTQAPKAGDAKLDFSFIQGGPGMDPSAWEAVNSQYIPGRYLLEVLVNDQKPVKQAIDITPADRDALCLKAEWLIRAGVFIDTAYFKDTTTPSATATCWPRPRQ